MKSRGRMSVGPPLLATMAAVVGGGLFLSRQLTQARHNPAVASFSIDADISDNIYGADPDGSRSLVGTTSSMASIWTAWPAP